MRQLWVKVPAGKGGQVLELAKKNDGTNLIKFQGGDSDGDLDIVILNVANDKVSNILNGLDQMEHVEITFYPQDVYPLSPPSSTVPKQIRHVQPRSPLEVWLNGLQSIGSWKGFMGYTLAAAIVAWIGMYTNSVYLLVGAMLVAPFAGPAMNLAMASATGDRTLLWRNLVRYFTSLTVTIILAAILSLIFQQRVATLTMVQVSEISAITVLLPLTAGAVGALNLSQATSNSLVSGAMVGMLVAAALAPPAALVGMAGAIGRWDMAVSGIFVLLLQLLGINITGGIVFRYYNLSPQGARFERGKQGIYYLSLGISALLLVGMVIWQFSSSPNLERSTKTQRAEAAVQQVVQDYGKAKVVQINMSFTRPSISGQNTLLGLNLCAAFRGFRGE